MIRENRLQAWPGETGISKGLIDGWNRLGLVCGWAAYEACARPVNRPALKEERLRTTMERIEELKNGEVTDLRPIVELIRDGLGPVVWVEACQMASLVEAKERWAQERRQSEKHRVAEMIDSCRGAMICAGFWMKTMRKQLDVLGVEGSETGWRLTTLMELSRDLEYRGGTTERFREAATGLERLIPPLLTADVAEYYGLNRGEDDAWRYNLDELGL
jgi:hypothetical protein